MRVRSPVLFLHKAHPLSITLVSYVFNLKEKPRQTRILKDFQMGDFRTWSIKVEGTSGEKCVTDRLEIL